MGSYEDLFLQMQLDLISHLKFVWYLMLIVALLILGIGFFHNIMNLLLDVLDVIKKFGFSIILSLRMGGIYLCDCNGKRYVNGGQWLEPQTHLKWVVANRVVEGSIVAMLNIRKAIIPCALMFGIINSRDMNNNHVDYLCLSISLWVEGNRFGHLGVHHRP
jgi:hypothetical protein